MSVAFPGLMPSLGSFPKAAWGGTAPSPPLAIRHRKKSRGQDGAVALPKDSRGFVGVGAQIAGLVCECTLEGAGPYSPSPGWQSGAQGRGDTPSDLLILLGTSLGE